MGLKRSSLERDVPKNASLLLDSTAIIAYFHGGEPTSPVAEFLIDQWISPGRNIALVSAVTVMEVLVKPITRSTSDFQTARDFLTRFPHLEVIPTDIEIATEAAVLRACQNLKPPDALIIATGLVRSANAFVTNDAAWARKLLPLDRHIGIVELSHYISE